VQEEVAQNGHAIECRIYAEDPYRNFMPSPGRIRHLTEPLGTGVRQDGYVYPGFEIPIYYDPMISKLITWGRNREETISRMTRALSEYKITGVKTSIPFLSKIMKTPDFVNGAYDTGFIEKNHDLLFDEEPCDPSCEDRALIVAYIDYLNRIGQMQPSGNGKAITLNPWRQYGKAQSIKRL
ncbi:MAG: acetyl-CoA carboxylase biotin carboxylase subunit, partial [Bacteroidales bacterium]|nr:acetyl-CoA carboxylase biotin carboxylase subunit [Bacteroidales bacterium]